MRLRMNMCRAGWYGNPEATRDSPHSKNSKAGRGRGEVLKRHETCRDIKAARGRAANLKRQ